MEKLRAFWLRLRGVFVRRKAIEFDAELESHIAMDSDDAMRAGLSKEEAHRQAVLRLGGAEQTRQAFRDRATLPPVESLLQDVRFAVRQMRRAPGFTITAVLTLALGIGANAVIYTLVDSILLRPLPYPQQQQLVKIVGYSITDDTNATSYPKGWIRELGSHSRSLASTAGYGSDVESNLSSSDTPDRVFGASVTVNALNTLGIHPALGSFFTTEDAVSGQDHDVILSYSYWRQHFAEDASAVGRSIRIDGVSRRIIGVMPEGVHFPYADTQFVIPVSYRGDDPVDPWKEFDLQAFGRLANGVAPSQAQAELRGLHNILLPIFPWQMPDQWASAITVVPLLESETGAIRPKLLLLFGAVGLIGHSVRIIGVLPKDFEMPRLQHADIIRPAQIDEASQHTANSVIGVPMWAFARLKPGVSVQQAKAEMQPLFLHTQQWIPPEIRKDFHLQVRSIRDRQMQNSYQAAWILLGAVLVVLLIACANVASLFSARGAVRARELAVRAALGASRGRLIRQTFTEAFLLAITGAAVGCALAEALLLIFIHLAPTGVPFLAQAQLDLRIVLFAIVVSLLCAGIFGILPALEKPRATALVARQTKSMAQARLRRVLVVVQIGLSMVLLSGASLLLKSFRNLQQVSLGMQTQNVLTVHIPLNEEHYPNGYQEFYLRAEAAFRQIPGMTAVGMSDSVPPDGDSWHSGFRYSELTVAGEPPTPSGIGGTVVSRTVTPDYFRVLQIPILQGRNFTEVERSSKDNLVILSRDLAAHLFPHEDPIGRHIEHSEFRPYRVAGSVSTVIGVAANVKNSGLAGQDDPELYELRTNLHPETWGQHHIFLIESSFSVSAVAPWIRSQVAQLDPVAPVEINTLSQTVSTLADRPRFEMALLTFFACTGLAMAVIGLYGVVAFMAVQRTQEIGIRMALGATRTDVLGLILREAFRLILIGGAIGLGAALALSRVLQSALFSVSPRDPLSFIAVSVLLALVAFVAALIPARSAMKTDPMTALRWE